MITSVHWILVLPVTVAAHLKVSHGGFGAVVWKILNDCESGPTIGAVDKGIEMSAVLGGEKFPSAGLTQGNILRDQYIRALLLLTGQYFECLRVLAFNFGDFFHVNFCQGGHVAGCIGQELWDSVPFQFHSYTLRAVKNEAFEIESLGTPKDKRAKTYSLNNAFV
jgi:hypothetical protein